MAKAQVHVVVKHVADNVMDVFWDKGWDQWSRVQLVPEPKPEFVHVAGTRLPFFVRIALHRYLRVDR